MSTGTFGGDFAILWAIGRAVLDGMNPYAVFESWYPPATSLAFAIFALVPPATSFVMWNGMNVLLLSAATDRKPARWLLYFPTIFMFIAGQIDLFFLALATRLTRGGWQAAISAALITLKPQLAFILLPWFLARWLVVDRRTLARFFGASALLHAAPLLYDPAIYANWLARISMLSGERTMGAPGIFGLSAHGWPAVYLYALAAVIAGLVGLAGALDLMPERRVRPWLALIDPAIMQYDLVLLMNTAPWYIMVPVSWLTIPLVLWLKSPLPFAAMPLAAIIWQVGRSAAVRTAPALRRAFA